MRTCTHHTHADVNHIKSKQSKPETSYTSAVVPLPETLYTAAVKTLYTAVGVVSLSKPTLNPNHGCPCPSQQTRDLRGGASLISGKGKSSWEATDKPPYVTGLSPPYH